MAESNNVIDDIIKKLHGPGDEIRLTEDEKAIIREALKNIKTTNKNRSVTTYELNDKNGYPVMYLDIASGYPKPFVIKQIQQCIDDDVDSDVIRSRLAKNCEAVEVNLEHIILPHIE